MEKLEKERKFLVKLSRSWASLSDMFDNLIGIKRITQTYLVSFGGEPATRVRKTVSGLIGNPRAVYHFNQKELVAPGVHKEKEKKISRYEYEQYLTKFDKNKIPIAKTRFIFKYCDQVFELDIFKGLLKGLAVLEIELKDMNYGVKPPPFLHVIKEVTGDKQFSNFNLANKDLSEELLDILDI